MEIHNGGHNHRLHMQPNSADRQTSRIEGQQLQAADEVKPSQLLERLEGDAKVRERLLVEIQAKVHAGEYMTRAAAEQAAQQIVD